MKKKEPVKVGLVEVTLTDVILPMGLTLHRVEVNGNTVEVPRDPVGLVLKEPAQMTVTVTAAQLKDFLGKKAPGGLRDFVVRLKNNRIHVEASMKVLIEIRASAVCRLRVHEGRLLYVDLDSVDVLGVGARNLIQSQLDAINPVLDMAELPVNGTIQSVSMDNDLLVVYGTVTP